MARHRCQLLSEFTTDSEIHCWVDNDDSIELYEFVDLIEDIEVKKNFKKGDVHLYKAIVSNGSRSRTCVLFWNEKAIEFSTKISESTVIRIINGIVRKRRSEFSFIDDSISSLELIIGQSTNVIISSETFNLNSVVPIANVLLRNSRNFIRRMYVNGWLKVPFTVVQEKGKPIRRGVIIDKQFKLRVKINNYRSSLIIPEGTSIRILCRSLIDDNGVPYLAVENSDDININNTVPVLSSAELRTSGHVTS